MLDLVFGKINYETHDESDAVAIALCHTLNKNKAKSTTKSKGTSKAVKGRGMAASLAHKLG